MTKAVAGLDPLIVTDLLRAGALAIKPEEIGLGAAECPDVWGLMLELGYSEVVVSLVALIDGSVSVYLSDGSGVIGCGLHPEVRNSARKLLNLAQRHRSCCTPTQVFPMPGNEHVFFYLLTPQGVRTAQVSRIQLDRAEIELAELYYAAHGLIELIELSGAGVDLVDELRLAESRHLQAQSAANSDINGAANLGAPELKARGRACRILPYAGNAARRWHN